MITAPPVGLDAIIAMFGDPHDPTFEAQYIVPFTLPYPLVFNGSMTWHARGHRLAVENFLAAFEAIKDNGLIERATEYGGIYANRSIRGFPKFLSTHAFGIAVDVEPQRFPLGSDKRQHPGVIQAFADAGFFYGGNFKARKDPQHFQLASGY